jgi:hypothetical protein
MSLAVNSGNFISPSRVASDTATEVPDVSVHLQGFVSKVLVIGVNLGFCLVVFRQHIIHKLKSRVSTNKNGQNN